MSEFKIIIDTAAAGDLDKAIKLLKEYEANAKQAQRESGKIGESFSKSNRNVQDELKKVTLEVNKIEQANKSLDATQQQSLSNLKKRQQELTKEARDYAKAQKEAQQVIRKETTVANGILGQQVNRLKELRKAAQEAVDASSLQQYNEEIVKVSNRIKQLKADTGSLNREFDASGASYNQLVQRNKELRQSMNRLPFNDTSGELDRLKREFNANTQALKRFDAEIGQNFRNVGNYEEAIRGAIAGLRGFGGGLASGIAGGGGLLGGAASGLAAVPQLAALGAGIQGLTGITQTFQEVNNQLRITSSITDATGQELTDLVGQIRATSNVFQQDYNETLRATNSLIETFGKNGDEALALINEGFLRGANISGDFLDQINEYSVQFKSAGLEAEQLVATIINGADQGIFSDKAVDAVKEGTLRLRELTTATRAALDGIGLSSAEIERSLESGEKNIADIISLVSEQLATLPPQSAKVGRAIADIFGGPGEDAGLDFLLTLRNINKEFNDGFGPLNKYQQKQADLIASQTQLDQAIVRLGDSFSGLGDSLSILTNDVLIFLVEELNDLFSIIQSNEQVVGRFAERLGKTTEVEKLQSELESLKTELKETEPSFLDYVLSLGNSSQAAINATRRQGQLRAQIAAVQGRINQLTESQKDNKTSTDDLDKSTDNFRKTQEETAQAVERTAIALERISGAGLQTGLDRAINGNDDISTFLEAYQAAFAESFLDPTKTIEEEYQDFANRIGNELQKISDKHKSEEEARTEATKQEARRRQEITNEALFASSELAGALFEITSQQRDKQIADLERQKQAEIDAVNGNQDAILEIEKRTERERREIQRRQAIAEKKLALFNIAIRTAQGIAGALASVPPNIPLSVIIGAIGAAQLATVAAQPIPGFFRGTDASPEGLAYVGERGQELVMEKSGRAYLTPQTKSLTYLPKDSRVLTAEETRELMSNSPELFKQSTRTPIPPKKQAVNLAELAALSKQRNQEIETVVKEVMKQMTVHQYIPNERGLRRFIVKGGKRVESMNKSNSLGGNG